MFCLVKKFGPLCAAIALIATIASPHVEARSRVGSGVSLLVWTNLEPSELKVAQEYANGWAGKNGASVKVLNNPSGTFQGFAQVARSGKGPDVQWGIPDDNIGTFQLAGLLAPVPSGIYNPKEFVPVANQAVTFQGQAYAVPVMLDTYTLVYNKKLVPRPPTSFAELIKMAEKFPNKKGKTWGFLFDPTNFYYSYAFIRGCGGYVFKQSGSSVDTNNIGLGNAGTIKTLTFIRDLVQKYKLIPSDMTYPIATSFFQKGQAAMTIDGDWDIGINEKALGTSNLGAALLPAVPGCGKPHPYAGVQVAFVSAYSHNQAMAWSLIKYLLQNVEIPDFQASGRIPAVIADIDNPAIQKDPVYSVYAKSALAGDPLPNVPEMSAVWTPAGNAITLVDRGKSSPSAAAANMVKQIKQGIAQLKS
jgi:arabinogalactan oligomer/maltooligosaccharide transport system substrate-binding protein